MKFKKLAGWFLLISGLVMIFWILYSSFNIFSAKSAAPEIFRLKEEKSAMTRPTKQIVPIQKGREEAKKIISEQLNKIMPPEFSTKFLNLISWSIFAGIFLFGGGKISGIGVNLMK